MEFVEISSVYQQRHHVMRYFDAGIIPKKKDGFLEKFYAGEDFWAQYELIKLCYVDISAHEAWQKEF